MKIMVVGGGGREHAIIKKIKESKSVEKIFALPGNGGMAADATLVDIGAKDIEKIVEFAVANSIDYAVEIAMWLCEDAGLTNEIESNLQKVKSSLKSMTNEYDDVTGLSELKEMFIKVENYYELVTTAECSYKEFNTEIDKYTDEILKIIDHLDFIYE